MTITVAATLIAVVVLLALFGMKRKPSAQQQADVQYGTTVQAQLDEEVRRRWVRELGEALQARDWNRIESLHRKMSGFVFEG